MMKLFKIKIKMGNVCFELEFDDINEAFEFLYTFMRNNPQASLVYVANSMYKDREYQKAFEIAAALLGVETSDPVFQKACAIVKMLMEKEYDN